MTDDLQFEAVSAALRIAPPASVGATAWLGLIDWGIVTLLLSAVYALLSIYWGWRKHKRGEEAQKMRQEFYQRQEQETLKGGLQDGHSE
jgi:membrane protein implicated in regulation of membrane protease activity